MQEKDIRKQLNQELDEMAPDILNKILAHPIEPVKSEKELFGKNKPLFKEKKNVKKLIWAPALALAACIAIAIFAIQPGGILKNPTSNRTVAAFSINIDVNPSIDIDVDKDGNVLKVKARNKDAKQIVKTVNEKIAGEETEYNRAVKLVVKELNRSGYFEKKNAMLLSVVSENRTAAKDSMKDLKDSTKFYLEEKKIKCTAVYQNCELNDNVVKVAEKNDVSIGKAAFCMKLAEKENMSVNKMCKKSINTLVKKATKSGATYADDEIEIEIDDEEETLETESMTETESGSFEPEPEEESVSEEEIFTETPSEEPMNVTVEEGEQPDPTEQAVE